MHRAKTVKWRTWQVRASSAPVCPTEMLVFSWRGFLLLQNYTGCNPSARRIRRETQHPGTGADNQTGKAVQFCEICIEFAKTNARRLLMVQLLQMFAVADGGADCAMLLLYVVVFVRTETKISMLRCMSGEKNHRDVYRHVGHFSCLHVSCLDWFTEATATRQPLFAQVPRANIAIATTFDGNMPSSRYRQVPRLSLAFSIILDLG